MRIRRWIPAALGLAAGSLMAGALVSSAEPAPGVIAADAPTPGTITADAPTPRTITADDPTAGVPEPGPSTSSTPAPGQVAASGRVAGISGASGSGTHVVAVGDVGFPGGPVDRTASLVVGLHPSRVLLAGDVAYPNGSAADFATWFDPHWGQFRSILLPVPGNHEYRTSHAAGYRAYFAETGGLHWSRKVGGWRVIGLDSERVSSTAQQDWVRRTLRKYNGVPTIVMWHRPRYSRGQHSDQRDTAALYNLVRRDRDVKLLLWGHDHDYERMSIPVRDRASRLPAFVVGTGGAELRCGTTNAGRTWSRFFNCRTNGVLDLRLRSRSFSWAYVTVDGSILDRGTTRW